MDNIKLVEGTVELALNLLEKNGSFLPFGRGLRPDGEPVVFVEGHVDDRPDIPMTPNQMIEAVSLEAKKWLDRGEIVNIAYCKGVNIRTDEMDIEASAIKVMLRAEGNALDYYFLYELENGKARLINYLTQDVNNDQHGTAAT
jgi:hypothetical protein